MPTRHVHIINRLSKLEARIDEALPVSTWLPGGEYVHIEEGRQYLWQIKTDITAASLLLSVLTSQDPENLDLIKQARNALGAAQSAVQVMIQKSLADGL